MHTRSWRRSPRARIRRSGRGGDQPGRGRLAEQVGTARACALLGRSRASHYRAKNPPPARQPRPRPAPPDKLSLAERELVLAVLTSAGFADKSVAQTWARLLDEGTYLCSMSTMHRILRENAMAGCERRRQATRPQRKRPELVATGPGQIWAWDITKLRVRPDLQRGVLVSAPTAPPLDTDLTAGLGCAG